jgi:hypothetical protein
VKRPRDQIRVETDAGGFEAFERVELVHDLLDVTAASLAIGDERSWAAVERLVEPGSQFRIYLNDRLQMTGRAEVNEIPADAQGGSMIQLTCRTKLSDANYRSADPSLKLTGGSIKDFLLQLFAPLGYTANDFEFAPAADRAITTGKAKGAEPPVDLEPLKPDQLKITPPETIREAAARHLRRHHMMLWDGADGRILVGKPAVSSPVLYPLICRRGVEARSNNLLGIKRVRDWSELPSEVWVYGTTTGADVAKSAIRGVAVDLDAARVAADSGHFDRVVIIPGDGVRTRARADAQAQRELAARSKRKDCWEAEVDGWSFWTGNELVPYAINTMASVEAWQDAGRANGRYLIARLARVLDPMEGAISSITLVHPSALEI